MGLNPVSRTFALFSLMRFGANPARRPGDALCGGQGGARAAGGGHV